jgi:hypothetical protein
MTVARLGPLTSWLRFSGWVSTAEDHKLGILWEKSGIAVVVPSADAPDVDLRTQIAIQAIAEVEGIEVSSLIQQVSRFSADVVEWRVVDATSDDDGLSLAVADQLLSTVRRVVVFAAASVEQRRGYFGRRVKQRARAESARVRVAQTQRGSFILPLVSNLPEVLSETVPSLVEVETVPFSRQVLQVVESALTGSRRLADQTSRNPTARESNELVGEGVSYEMSSAMADLLESDSVAEVDVKFTWGRLATLQASRTKFTPADAPFFRSLAANLFESSEIGVQQLLLSVRSSSRFDEPGRDGGVVVFRRDFGDGSRSLIRAELDEAQYQTVLSADSERNMLVVMGKLIEEEGHRTRLEEVRSVRRQVQGTFD